MNIPENTPYSIEHNTEQQIVSAKMSHFLNLQLNLEMLDEIEETVLQQNVDKVLFKAGKGKYVNPATFRWMLEECFPSFSKRLGISRNIKIARVASDDVFNNFQDAQVDKRIFRNFKNISVKSFGTEEAAMKWLAA